ncbi:S1C family serine protease [Thermoproteota archaeon]
MLVHIFSAILLVLTSFICQKQAIAQSSIIATIDNSLKSIVYIKSESAVIGKDSDVLVKDEKTGKILLMKRAKGAKFDRTGSGVIIDATGIIVTNAHIVQNAGRITVTLNDQTKYEAEVLWIASGDDLAFLRIKPKKPLTPLPLSHPDTIKLNATVYTIGSSEILDGTITQGKITGIGKSNKKKKQKGEYADLIQIGFNLYKGDSGAPLLDNEGKLLGLMIATQRKQSRKSFAIPAYKIKAYLQQFSRKFLTQETDSP